MRKIYFLAVLLLLCCETSVLANDSARFSITVLPSFKVSFTNTSVIQDTARRRAVWYFGDGTRAITHPLEGTHHQYAGGGRYTVCLKIYRYNETRTDSGVVAEACKVVELEHTNTPDSCRASFEVKTTATSVLKRSFLAQSWHNHQKKPERICWTFGDGRDTCINYDPALSKDYIVHHEYKQAGNYTTCVRIRYQGGCVADQCRVVQVTTADGCRTEIKVEPVAGAPMSRSFTALASSNLQKKPTRICWNFGDGRDTCINYTNSYTGSYNVHHTYANTGEYKVCTRVVYDGGCVAEQCLVQAISPTDGDCAVKATEIVAPNNHLERRFYASLSPGRKAERICWSLGDGRDTCYALPDPPTAQTLTIGHLYPAPGVYRLTVSVWYSGGCKSHAVKEVVIRGSSSVCGAYMTDSVLSPGVYVFRGYGVVGSNDRVSSYRWTFGDGSGSTGQHTVHEFRGGNYQVCLLVKTEKGCEARICKPLIVPEHRGTGVQVKPNPVLSELIVLFQSTQQETVTISLFNANGVMVRSYTRSAVVGANRWAFDVAALPKGIYSVVVHSANQTVSTVFIKQ